MSCRNQRLLQCTDLRQDVVLNFVASFRIGIRIRCVWLFGGDAPELSRAVTKSSRTGGRCDDTARS